jgi:predicted neutral ceramidase superfamily lipid hydrolase
MKKCNQELSNAMMLLDTPLDKATLRALVKQRVTKEKDKSMQYFWASLVMQIIVYSLLSNVIIKHREDLSLLLVSAFCILLYIPFTIVLLRDFKKLALLTMPGSQDYGLPVRSYVQEQYFLLKRHYIFKVRYEFLLITCSVFIMTWIIFRIYVPGGITAQPIAALSILTASIVACVYVSLKDNKKHFKGPMKQLENILTELDNNN